jgi:hypothetical protein
MPREETATAPRPTRALERRSITLALADPEREQLIGEARQAGTTLPQYIRTRCSLKIRNTSLPGTDEADDAWQILKGLGLNPTLIPARRVTDLSFSQPATFIISLWPQSERSTQMPGRNFDKRWAT